MKKTIASGNTFTDRIAGIVAQRMLVRASLLFFLAANAAHAAKVVAINPQYGVKGSTVVIEGTSWGFSTTVTTLNSGNNRIATIKNPTDPTPQGRDHWLSANPGTLNTTIYRYVQVFYSLASDFDGSVQQLFLQTSDQSLGHVSSFLNTTSIPSTSGSHSFIIDLQDGTTSIGGNGYSGNLTLFRWDFWNDNIADNDGKSMTVDRIVFASELVAEPDKIDTVLLTDNFNTSNGSAIRDLATRQTGTMAPESYDSGNINSGMLAVGGICQADFTPHIKNTEVSGFKLSFDAAYTGGADTWSSPYLSTHPPSPDERSTSEIGLLIRENGDITAYRNPAVTVSAANLTTLLGSWDVRAMNNYSLVSNPTTATNGTYDVYINGQKIDAISNIAYTIGTGGANAEINWEVLNIANGGANYDNLYVSTFIIPAAGTLFIIN